jgi:hypothetical protein
VIASFDLASLITPSVVAAIVAGVITLMGSTIAAWRTSIDRRRQMFADAYMAYRAYCEVPYAVHRRRHDRPEDERIRLTNELREIQQKIGFFQAWTTIEAPEVGRAFGNLVGAMRRVAGAAITDAWSRPAITKDGQVPVGTAIDLSSLGTFEDAYLATVLRHSHRIRARLPLFNRSPATPSVQPPRGKL